MIRFFIALVIVGVLAWCGATVNLGKRTLFGHIHAVWSTPEAADLKEDLKKSAGPTAEKIKRGVEAGLREARRAESDAGVTDAGVVD